MRGSVNKVILVGNLGKDPEVRSMQDGSKIVNMTIATSESWNDRASGQRKERTEWHRVVIFNERTADVAERFLRKGAKIYVEGSLQTRKWTDQQSVERYATEIVIGRFNGQLTMLDSRSDESAPRDRFSTRRPERTSEKQRASQPEEWDAPRGGGEIDDAIPFAPEFR